jgi:hypothetical protein
MLFTLQLVISLVTAGEVFSFIKAMMLNAVSFTVMFRMSTKVFITIYNGDQDNKEVLLRIEKVLKDNKTKSRIMSDENVKDDKSNPSIRTGKLNKNPTDKALENLSVYNDRAPTKDDIRHLVLQVRAVTQEKNELEELYNQLAEKMKQLQKSKKESGRVAPSPTGQ